MKFHFGRCQYLSTTGKPLFKKQPQAKWKCQLRLNCAILKAFIILLEIVFSKSHSGERQMACLEGCTCHPWCCLSVYTSASGAQNQKKWWMTWPLHNTQFFFFNPHKFCHWHSFMLCLKGLCVRTNTLDRSNLAHALWSLTVCQAPAFQTLPCF